MDRSEGERRAAKRPGDQPNQEPRRSLAKRVRLGKDEQESAARPAERRGEQSGLCEDAGSRTLRSRRSMTERREASHESN